MCRPTIKVKRPCAFSTRLSRDKNGTNETNESVRNSPRRWTNPHPTRRDSTTPTQAGLSQNVATHGHLFAMVRECVVVSRSGDCVRGLLDDVLLFSSVGEFFLGFVLAAASLLG